MILKFTALYQNRSYSAAISANDLAFTGQVLEKGMDGRQTAINGDEAQAGCALAVDEGIHIRRGCRFGRFVTDYSEKDIEVAGIAFRRSALAIAAVDVLDESVAGLVYIGPL